jgi:hypothetical protein
MVNDRFVGQAYTYIFTTQKDQKRLNFFFYGIGIKNTTSSRVKVYFDEYNPDSYVIVDANHYEELDFVGNWFRYEFLDSLPFYNLEVTVFTLSSNDFLVPRFPNLYIADPNNPSQYYLYNPLNQDGFMTETWNFGEGSLPYNSESIVEVDYWVMGQKIPVTSLNFKDALFNAIVTNLITTTYPYSTVNEVLSILPGGQESEIISKVKNFFSSLDTPLNDEFFGGWAKLQYFDRKLSLLSYNLTSGDKLYLPFPILGFTVKNLSSSSNASFTTKLGGPSGTVVVSDTIPAGQEKYYHLVEIDYLEVTSGNVEVKFHGTLAKLLSYAPVVNIYYPFGFDETSGQPTQAYTTFQNQLAELENQLANSLFTGRVVKYKWVAHQPQHVEVWDADHFQYKIIEPTIKTPYKDIQPYLKDWYAYNKFEEKLIERVYYDNQSAFPVEPKTMDDIINNNSANIILFVDFSSVPVAQRPTEKRRFIDWLLQREYLGLYGKGTLPLVTTILPYGEWIYSSN